jgi:hypothetical protein
MEKEHWRLAREFKNQTTRGRAVRAPECGDLPTRRHEIFQSSGIVLKSHKQNLFTAGVFDLKKQ